MSGLSAEQIEQYHRDGFVSPIDVYTSSEIAEIRAAYEAAEQAHPDQLHPTNRNNAHLVVPVLDEVARHPTVLDCVRSLIGPDIVLWGSVMFIKEPSSTGYVSWHQDGRYMGLDPLDFATPWIALTDSTISNGCMAMIPGSQRQPLLDHRDTFDEENILTRGQNVDGVDAAAAVNLELRAGQMSIHHPRTIHGSQPNPSNQRRIGFALQSYIAAHVRQLRGDAYAADVGAGVPSPYQSVPPPTGLCVPSEVARRDVINHNYADILYDGAEQRRSY